MEYFNAICVSSDKILYSVLIACDLCVCGIIQIIYYVSHADIKWFIALVVSVNYNRLSLTEFTIIQLNIFGLLNTSTCTCTKHTYIHICAYL